jgi:hypothetical protein
MRFASARPGRRSTQHAPKIESSGCLLGSTDGLVSAGHPSQQTRLQRSTAGILRIRGIFQGSVMAS